METGVYLISACLMTYRPLLERFGTGGVVGKLRHLAKAPDGSPATPQNARRQITDIPLKMRAEDDKHGFYRLENDIGVDPQIKVTTNISVT